STRGTTPIYQEIPNLSAAKSAYGNIVYRKAPSFLRQAEFYLGEDKFQTAVRAFLKKHEFGNGRWEDLVSDFARAKYNLPESGGEISPEQLRGVRELLDWANGWIKQRGVPIIKLEGNSILQKDALNENSKWIQKFKIYTFEKNPNPEYKDVVGIETVLLNSFNRTIGMSPKATFIFPNYQDYGYGIFLLDEKSRAYVLANIQNEKGDFLRTMMWGSLWDSVRETELAPRDYVELVIKNINIETDESTIQTLLSRVSTAMNYYLSEPSAVAGGLTSLPRNVKINPSVSTNQIQPSATADGSDKKELAAKLEAILIDKIQNAPTLGQRITFYRAFLNVASGENARKILKDILSGKFQIKDLKLKTKDRFDIVTKLLVLGDKDAPSLLAELEKTETTDEAKRYAYAAKAGIGTAENKAKFWTDFVGNKELSESWIESAFVPSNAARHSELTLPYLEKALAELPNLKRSRKIFFVNGWLAAFIGGQKDEKALAIVNKFLADNPNLDKDLRLKILENVDGLERAVRIKNKFK
ncbi:MAG: M1 family metallopeptidase, partial [Pyrinomonadaceae bacterium]|nr:M1 family metallopeptidase [Pyrinomonadaceae bacterium]